MRTPREYAEKVSSRNDSRPLLLWGPVVVVMAAIFVISSLPQPPIPAGMNDKSGHMLGYAVVAFTVVRALAGGLPRHITPRVALLAVAITVAYGITDEIHQRYVPGRSAEMADLYADAAGALIATVACWAWGILAVRMHARLPPPGGSDRNHDL